jgi:hypothetical protein
VGLPAPPAAEPLDPALIYGPGHATLIAEASASLAAGKRFPLPLDAGLPTLRLIDSIYAKARWSPVVSD